MWEKNYVLDGGGILYFVINVLVLGGLLGFCCGFKFENGMKKIIVWLVENVVNLGCFNFKFFWGKILVFLSWNGWSLLDFFVYFLFCSV